MSHIASWPDLRRGVYYSTWTWRANELAHAQHEHHAVSQAGVKPPDENQRLQQRLKSYLALSDSSRELETLTKWYQGWSHRSRRGARTAGNRYACRRYRPRPTMCKLPQASRSCYFAENATAPKCNADLEAGAERANLENRRVQG